MNLMVQNSSNLTENHIGLKIDIHFNLDLGVFIAGYFYTNNIMAGIFI